MPPPHIFRRGLSVKGIAADVRADEVAMGGMVRGHFDAQEFGLITDGAQDVMQGETGEHAIVAHSESMDAGAIDGFSDAQKALQRSASAFFNWGNITPVEFWPVGNRGNIPPIIFGPLETNGL